MSAFASLSDLVAKASGANARTLFWHKTGRVAGVQITPTNGAWNSAWLYDGSPSGAAAAPGAVAAPDNTTTGSLFQPSAGGGREQFVTNIVTCSYGFEGIRHYDRLLHISGLSGTVTTAQNVGGAITRNTGGVGNQIWVEIYTQVGATPTTITAAYTNQAGAAKTSTAVVFGGTTYREIYRMFPIPLAAGDTGVQGVTSVTLAGSSGTAGDFGITVLRPICTTMPTQSQNVPRNFLGQGRGPYKLPDGACIATMFLPTVSIFLVRGSITLVES